MFKLQMMVVCLFVSSISIAAAPTIENLTAKQRYPWNGKVDITYTINGQLEAGCTELIVSAKDNVSGTSYTATKLSGDLAKTTGVCHLIWDMDAQGLNINSADVSFSVKYKSKYPLYCVIDLSGGTSAKSYPVTYLDAVPSGGWTTEHKTTKLVLRRIDPGTFKMNGSYNVTLTQPYYCGVFEVTQKQYELVTGKNPSNFSGDALSVERMSWNMIRGDSNTYNWPNVRTVASSSFLGLLQTKTSLGFDLPTEAQWEYACRAGTTTTYYWGDVYNKAYSWIYPWADNTTHIVGVTKPNAWGLYDMSGNVYEWCLDWYGYLSSTTNPDGPSSGTGRVLRGGSWDDSNGESSRRYYLSPSNYFGSDRGFRIARVLSEVDFSATDLMSSVRMQNKSFISMICYNSSWISSDDTATVVITDNGTEIKRATGEGEFEWNPETPGKHVLTYTTFIDGVAQDDVYTVTVYADWKYTVEDGKAILTETTEKSGVVTIPAIIDGYIVGGIFADIFDGCTEIEAISVPSSLKGIVNTETWPGEVGYYGLPISMGGNADWMVDTAVTTSGNGSFRSGEISNSQESWLEATVMGAGLLTFKWKVSSEAYMGFVSDYAYLSVDGVALGTLTDYVLSGHAIGGETDWARVSLPIEGDGEHVVRWTYKKDATDDNPAEEDCVWVDEIEYKKCVEVAFDGDGASGIAPDSISSYQEQVIVLPSAEGLAKAKHSFAGWSNGVDTYSAGTEYVLPETNITLTAVWTAKNLAVPVIESDDVENGGEIDTASAMIRIAADEGASIYYTLDGSDPTVASSLYEGPFTADGMDVEIKAIAIQDDWFDSPVASFAFTRKPYSFVECLNLEVVNIVSEGNSQWSRVLGEEAHDGIAALKSGAIGDGESSSLVMTVNGPGEISFWWKVSSQAFKTIKFDYVSFEIDGVEKVWRGGEVDWTNEVWTVEGSGPHTIKWTYQKNAADAVNDDCAWLDEVVWTPAAVVDPIPELPSTATADEVAAALGGSADANLAANITDVANYAAYREWALGVKTADGSAAAGAETVKNAAYSWLSYALDTEKLIANAPVEGDATIDTFENAATDGAFDFTVNVKDIAIGDGALEANIRKVFDIEGVEDLATGTFSADAVEVNAAAAEGGKVKFTVTPKKDSEGVMPDRFFFKVKMK